MTHYVRIDVEPNFTREHYEILLLGSNIGLRTALENIGAYEPNTLNIFRQTHYEQTKILIEPFTRIDITGYGSITDLRPLSGLTNITRLRFFPRARFSSSLPRYHNVMDLGALSGLVNLSSLYMTHGSLVNIDGLEGLNNLGYLDLRDNEITDISVLRGLTGLTTLFIGDNNICDLLPIVNHPGLLDMYNNVGGQNCEDAVVYIPQPLPELPELPPTLGDRLDALEAMERGPIGEAGPIGPQGERGPTDLIGPDGPVGPLPTSVAEVIAMIDAMNLKNEQAAEIYKSLEISNRKLRDRYAISNPFVSDRFGFIRSKFRQLWELFRNNS